MAGAIIEGASSLLGGALGLFGSNAASRNSLQATRETNAQNYKIWREQIAEQRAQWERENAYNSPMAQRQRLEEAGYNPLASRDSGNASSMSLPNAPTIQSPDPTAFSNGLSYLGDAIANGARAAVDAAYAAENNKRANDIAMRQLKLLEDEHTRNQKELPYLTHFLDRQYDELFYGSKIARLNYEFQAGTLNNNIRMNQMQADQLAIQNASSLISLSTQQIFAQYDKENALNQMLSTAQTYYNMVSAGLMTETQMRTEILKQVGLSLDNEAKKIDNKILNKTANSIINAVNSANRLQYYQNNANIAIQKDFNSWYNANRYRPDVVRYRYDNFRWRLGTMQSGFNGGDWLYRRSRSDGYLKSFFDAGVKGASAAVGAYFGH